jgi:ketosteroid isomerase-like protein
MSAENVELMRAGQKQFAETGEPAWENLHPDVEVHDHDIPDAGSYRGHEGVVRWLQQWGEAWESFELGPTEFIDAGDKVVGLFTLTATGKGSGVKLERNDAIVWTLRDGKIIELDYFNNRPDALAAAGLPPGRL